MSCSEFLTFPALPFLPYVCVMYGGVWLHFTVIMIVWKYENVRQELGSRPEVALELSLICSLLFTIPHANSPINNTMTYPGILVFFNYILDRRVGVRCRPWGLREENQRSVWREGRPGHVTCSLSPFLSASVSMAVCLSVCMRPHYWLIICGNRTRSSMTERNTCLSISPTCPTSRLSRSLSLRSRF